MGPTTAEGAIGGVAIALLALIGWSSGQMFAWGRETAERFAAPQCQCGTGVEQVKMCIALPAGPCYRRPRGPGGSIGEGALSLRIIEGYAIIVLLLIAAIVGASFLYRKWREEQRLDSGRQPRRKRRS